VDRTDNGMMATVLDGVVGSRDGSGRWASRDNFVRLWRARRSSIGVESPAMIVSE
jgi:hypothetical protein